MSNNGIFAYTVCFNTLTSSISYLFRHKIIYSREIKALQEIEDNQNVSRTFCFDIIALFLHGYSLIFKDQQVRWSKLIVTFQ